MKTSHTRARAAALTMLTPLTLLAAESGALAHNYVRLDLTWQAPKPLPPGQIMSNVVLIDTDSAKKTGDTVEFDELILNPAYSNGASQLPRSAIMHYQFSCGWRTLRLSSRDNFLPHGSTFNIAVDKLCAGTPLDAARGAQTVEMAAAFFGDILKPVAGAPMNAITVQHARPQLPQTLQPWAENPHAFVPVPVHNDAGNALFLDRASLGHDGDTATAYSLVVLGPDSTRSSSGFSGVLMLRKVQYDCAQKTMTVLAQAEWNRLDTFVGSDDNRWGERAAKESPVTAADIHAACSGGEASSPSSFSTIEDAWAYARTSWPPSAPPAWVTCAWQHFPESVRTQYLSEWAQHAAQLPIAIDANQTAPWLNNMPPEVRTQSLHDVNDKLPNLPNLTASDRGVCAIPNPAPQPYQLSAYAMQRGAIEMLSLQHIDEAKIKSAWNEIPWLDQQQFAGSTSTYTADSLRKRKDVIGRVADRVGITKDDAAARAQVEYYLVGGVRTGGF